MTESILCIGSGWKPMQAAFTAPQDGVYLFSYSTVPVFNQLVDFNFAINLHLSTAKTQAKYSSVFYDLEGSYAANGMDTYSYIYNFFLLCF